MLLALCAFLTALAVSWVSIPLAYKLAVRYGVIVHPDARRVHAEPTPLWGGIAIWLGVVAGIACAEVYEIVTNSPSVITPQVWILLTAATVVAVIGMLDDKYQLSAAWQALALVGISLVVALLGIRIDFVTNIFGESQILPLGAWAVPVTVIWLFGATKTVDLVDGLDGLCAGVCAIASCALAIMALALGSLSVAAVCAAVTGASLGFLRFNFPPARIFMGTIGSQFMGFIIAGAAVIGAFKVAAAVAFLVPIFALGVPIFDAIFAVIRRALKGAPLHQADKGHIHHRLLDLGLNQRQAILVLYAATFLLSAAALVIFSTVR